MDQPQYQARGWYDGPRMKVTYPSLQKTRPDFKSKKQKNHMVSINIGDLPHCLPEKLLKLNRQITSKHMIICNKHHELKEIQTSLLLEYTIILLCSIVNFF